MPSCCSGQTVAAEKQKRPPCEVADIFREYGNTYQNGHPLPPSHQNVMKNIQTCRTARLGGHLEKCDCCGHERPAYNSCSDRHCPKCQSLKKARWLEARKKELLPVPYFHSVFTLPHKLNPITLCNKHVIYTILFKAVKETLITFARNKGGAIGFLALLHTWDQILLDHFHIHCLIPAGILSKDKNRWIPFSTNYLFPVKALSRVFRGKFIDYLKKAYANGDLIFPGKTSQWETQPDFSSLIDQLWENEWVVYCKPPIAGPRQVLDYLARYTNRVAISNHRIVEVGDGRVSFTCRDRKNGNRRKVMTLEATEFIRRFLLHVLPQGFVRIRYYGFLANRSKRENLERLSEILPFHFNTDEPERKNTVELMFELTGSDVTRCPSCGVGTMRTVALIPPLLQDYMNDHHPQPHILDSS
jgi:hypothetical protein